MSLLPSALVLCNADLTQNVQDALVTQLFLTQVLDGTTFDTHVANNVNYLISIKQNNQRVLVIRPLSETQHKELFDVVLFIKNGLAAVETNKFGPPGLTLPVIKLFWGALGIR